MGFQVFQQSPDISNHGKCGSCARNGDIEALLIGDEAGNLDAILRLAAVYQKDNNQLILLALE